LIRSHGGYVQSGPPEKSPFTVFPLEGEGGEGMEVDVVKDEIRVRSGETGKTEKEVESLLKEVLRGKERCFYYGCPWVEADILVRLYSGSE
jgi:hypothetical protein